MNLIASLLQCERIAVKNIGIQKSTTWHFSEKYHITYHDLASIIFLACLHYSSIS